MGAGSSSLMGYAITLASVLVTSVYNLYMSHLANDRKEGGAKELGQPSAGIRVLDLTFYNALLSIPLLLACAVMSDEGSTLWHRRNDFILSAGSMCAVVCAAASLALIYQISVVLCTTRNSALATSVAGVDFQLYAYTTTQMHRRRCTDTVRSARIQTLISPHLIYYDPHFIR